MKSEWKKVKVGDHISFQNGYAFKSKDFITNGTHKVVKIKELKDGKVKFFDDTATIEYKDQYKDYTINKGDILFALTGDPVSKPNPLSWVGRVSVYNHDETSLLNQRVCKAVFDEQIDPYFFYYFFRQFENFYALAAKATGSASQANISTKTIADMDILLPTIEEQRKIANILRNIDNVIDKNNIANSNMFEQAQAIYKNMFIDTQEDLTDGILSDIADITMGQSPKGDTYNEDKNGTVFFQGRAEFGFRFPTVRLYTTDPKRMAYKNDVLMSVRAPVGDVNIAHEDCCIGRGLAAIRSKTNHQSFVLYTILSLKNQLNIYNGEGTVFGSINREALNSLSIKIPPQNLIDEFENVVATIDKIILSNHDEICRLQSLRDTLLPKLISGDLDVSEVNI